MRDVPRQEIEQQILDAAIARSPRIQIIEAARGAGKSTLLRRIAGRLAARDRLPVVIDIERTAISPADIARHVPDAVDAALVSAGDAAPGARSIRDRLEAEFSRRRPSPSLLLDLALSYPQAAAGSSRSPIVLLLDELGEAAHLARHAGLRDALELVAARLAGASQVAVVATVSPASRPAQLIETLRRHAEPEMRVTTLPALNDAELAGLLRAWGCEPADGAAGIERWARATGAHPLYAAILAPRVARGEDLATALAREMTAPAGALHQECRFDYHLLVERSRGHSAVRAILALLGRQEGINLSGVAQHLRIALPTALDYLSWLLEVGLIRRDGSGYVFADPLLRLWVRLNGSQPADPTDEVARFLQTPRAAPLPASRPRGRRPRPAAPIAEPARARRDLLIEID